MTISSDALIKAVQQGVITAELADQLRAREAAERAPEDPEKLRFITGFGDIFVSIGIILLLVSIAFITANTTGSISGTLFTLAVINWALAEVFTRIRKMGLPSIILSILFYFCILFGFLFSENGTGEFILVEKFTGGFLIVPGIAAMISVALYYWRFRHPISPAIAGASLMVSLTSAFYLISPEVAKIASPVLIFLGGVAFFIAALRLDYVDPSKKTSRAETAFWLHLLSAPLIVYPLMDWAIALTPAVQSWAVLSIFFIMALISILADRRAILVAGMMYAGGVASILADSRIYRANSGSIWQVSYIFLAMGVFILILGVGWKKVRHGVFYILPARVRRVLPQEN